MNKLYTKTYICDKDHTINIFSMYIDFKRIMEVKSWMRSNSQLKSTANFNKSFLKVILFFKVSNFIKVQ